VDQSQNQFVAAWRRLRRMRAPMAGLTVLLLLILVAVLAPYLTAHHPTEGNNIMDAMTAPDSTFWFGTDHAGRDVLTRILHGARISLTVGLVVQSIALVIGTTLGLIAGYYGGWVDDMVMGLTTLLQAFPGYLLAIAVMAVIGPGLYNIYFVLGFVGWTTIARLVRGEVLSLREREFVESARAIGAPDARILLRHIFPNCLGPIIVTVTLGMGGAILQEASLSFLGLGAQPPAPSWGSMLAGGRDYIFDAPWLTFFPGAAIFLTILALNLFGDGLRDVLDPKLKM
jgi:ABC-type dipeptide/oligopeptide/nickel transport system permease subunit